VTAAIRTVRPLGVVIDENGVCLPVTVDRHLVGVGGYQLDRTQLTRLLALLIEGERNADDDPEAWLWR